MILFVLRVELIESVVDIGASSGGGILEIVRLLQFKISIMLNTYDMMNQMNGFRECCTGLILHKTLWFTN